MVLGYCVVCCLFCLLFLVCVSTSCLFIFTISGWPFLPSPRIENESSPDEKSSRFDFPYSFLFSSFCLAYSTLFWVVVGIALLDLCVCTYSRVRRVQYQLFFFWLYFAFCEKKKKQKSRTSTTLFLWEKKANDDRIQECTRSVHAEYLFFSCMLYVWEKLLGGRRMGQAKGDSEQREQKYNSFSICFFIDRASHLELSLEEWEKVNFCPPTFFLCFPPLVFFSSLVCLLSSQRTIGLRKEAKGEGERDYSRLCCSSLPW